MRIFAYACVHPDAPVRRGILPLTELTILLGPNDSGKSTWLRWVERDLRGGHVPTSDARDELRKVGVFYVHLTAKERARLFDEAIGTRASRRGESKAFTGVRPPWDDGLWHINRDAAHKLALPDSEEEVGPSLRDALSDGHPERAPILDALAESDIVASEPAGRPGGRPLWNIYWCLPPIDDSGNTVADELRDSDLRHFVDQRAETKSGVAVRRGPYEWNFPRPNHLRVDGAPVAVAAIGQARRFPMPTSLAVPTDAASIEKAVVEAISAVADAARWAPSDVRDDGPLSQEDTERRRAPKGWLKREGETTSIAPDVIAACAFVHQAANELLPDFIGERYELVIESNPIEDWFDQTPLRLRVRPHGGDRRDEFGLDAVADGLRLWLQLALLEAAEQTGRVRSYLFDLASDWRGQEEAAAAAYQDHDEDADALGDEAERLREEFDTAVESLRKIPEQGVTGELVGRLAVRPAEDILNRAARDRRLFVVDEPERHLHPRRQREAAEWLAATASDRAAPAVLASHSTAFLSLPATPGLSYVYCSRDGADSTVRRVTAEEIADLNRVGAEMGFDRGELLATVSMFLLVEGRHDEDVLTRVFRSDLADAHIAVVQIAGASNAPAILDSQALWKYTTAKVALATDKFTPERFKQLMGDEEELRRLRRHDAPPETKALATLMTNAKMQGKTVHLLGHAGDDLIDVLDEDVVQELHPKYPGHKQARQRWEQARQQDSKLKASNKKQWYAEHFGIQNDVVTYQNLGDALVQRGRRPPALAKIVEGAVKLTGSA